MNSPSTERLIGPQSPAVALRMIIAGLAMAAMITQVDTAQAEEPSAEVKECLEAGENLLAILEEMEAAFAGREKAKPNLGERLATTKEAFGEECQGEGLNHPQVPVLVKKIKDADGRLMEAYENTKKKLTEEFLAAGKKYLGILEAMDERKESGVPMDEADMGLLTREFVEAGREYKLQTMRSASIEDPRIDEMKKEVKKLEARIWAWSLAVGLAVDVESSAADRAKRLKKK